MKEAAARKQPFLLHVSFPRPHQCTTPCQEFWDLYEGDALSMPPNADYDLSAARKAPHMIASARRWRESDWQLFEPKTFEAGRRRKLHGYLGAVSQVDAAVGKLLDHFRSSGMAENTIVRLHSGPWRLRDRTRYHGKSARYLQRRHHARAADMVGAGDG